jgi:hypothetical protein
MLCSKNAEMAVTDRCYAGPKGSSPKETETPWFKALIMVTILLLLGAIHKS